MCHALTTHRYSHYPMRDNAVWLKDYSVGLSGLLSVTNSVDSSCLDLKILRWKSNKVMTPVEIEASEILNTGLKN